MDLGIADRAGEAAGTPVAAFFAGYGVIHPAARAGELLCGPDAVRHDATIRGPRGSFEFNLFRCLKDR